MNKKYLDLLNEMHDGTEIVESKKSVLLIDALNLFFRNFSVLNFVTPAGTPVGGLVGFLRSLGYMINETGVDKVIIIFDGKSSTNHRKNLIPEYKSNRNITKLTKSDIYSSLEEEAEGKRNQIGRLIHYLKCLPVQIISIDNSEADDSIAHMAKYISNELNMKSIIVSSDKDFLQLVSDDILVYRPAEKQLYNSKKVKEKFGVLSENYIIYKTILGDKGDVVKGISGIGEKTLIKLFPELLTKILTLDELFTICEGKYKLPSSIGLNYAKILLSKKQLEKNFIVMNLHNPIIDDEDKKYIEYTIDNPELEYFPNEFVQMYEEDQLGNIIKNPRSWLDNNFKNLKK